MIGLACVRTGDRAENEEAAAIRCLICGICESEAIQKEGKEDE